MRPWSPASAYGQGAGLSIADDLLKPPRHLHRMGVTEWCWTDYPGPQPPQGSGWLEAAGLAKRQHFALPFRPYQLLERRVVAEAFASSRVDGLAPNSDVSSPAS